MEDLLDVYWNQCETKIWSKDLDNDNLLRTFLDASCQGVKKLFVLAFDNTNNDNKKVERNNHKNIFFQE